MTVEELVKVIETLPAAQLQTDAYEARLDLSGRWYSNQREHLLGWLADYDKPGAYGRKNPGQDAKFFYNHFRCAPGLVWLAEALGEDRNVVTEGIKVINAARRNPSSQCGAFRRVVPWSRIAELIVYRPAPPLTPRTGMRLTTILEAAGRWTLHRGQ